MDGFEAERAAEPPVFGGSTGMTLREESFNLVALRLRLSIGFALYKGYLSSSSSSKRG